VCARFAIIGGPGESLKQRKCPKSGKSSLGAICLGLRIIAIHSPAISERQIQGSTSVQYLQSIAILEILSPQDSRG